MIRRKNYFVKKQFQASFFIKFALLMVLEGVLIAAIFYYISRGTLTAAYKGSEFVIERTNAYFFTDFITMTLMAGFAIAIAAGIVFMYLSHRIGGAIFRFEKTLEDARNGNFSQRVNLRRTDELFDLKDQFNLFLEAMDNRITAARQDADKGLKLLEDSKDPENIGRARETFKGLKGSLNFFKTSK